MPVRTLTRKPPDQARLDQELFKLAKPCGRATPAGAPRSAGRRLLGPAVVLSLALHGLLALMLAVQPTGRDGRPKRGLLNTRVAGVERTVDLYVSFPDDRPRPAPAPLKPPMPSPPATEATAPVVVPSQTPHLPPSTAPLTPAFVRGITAGQVGAAVGPQAGASGGNGGDGAISFFQVPAQGRRVVYLIDRSSSMGLDGALAAAKRELCASLDRLPADASFQVIAYNRGAEPLRLGGSSGLAPATAANKRQAGFLITSLRAEGGTAHLPALKRALLLQPEVIFFLTDGDDLTLEQVREVTRFNQGRTTIHALEVQASSSTSGAASLQVLARENRGVYRVVDLVNLAPAALRTDNGSDGPQWSQRRW